MGGLRGGKSSPLPGRCRVLLMVLLVMPRRQRQRHRQRQRQGRSIVPFCGLSRHFVVLGAQHHLGKQVTPRCVSTMLLISVGDAQTLSTVHSHLLRDARPILSSDDLAASIAVGGRRCQTGEDGVMPLEGEGQVPEEPGGPAEPGRGVAE